MFVLPLVFCFVLQILSSLKYNKVSTINLWINRRILMKSVRSHRPHFKLITLAIHIDENKQPYGAESFLRS